MLNKRKGLDELKEISKMINRGVLAIVSSVGVLLLLGVFSGNMNWEQLIFYTFQSNLIISIVYSYLTIRTLINYYRQRKLVNYEISTEMMSALMLMIVVTGLIFNLLLAPNIPSDSAYSPNNITNYITHGITPLLVFIDWLLFVPSKSLNRYSPLKWIIVPIAYWIYSIIRAYAAGPIASFGDGRRYAYFFIDADIYGWPTVFRNVFLLVLVFLLLGYCFLGIAKLKTRIVHK